MTILPDNVSLPKSTHSSLIIAIVLLAVGLASMGYWVYNERTARFASEDARGAIGEELAVAKERIGGLKEDLAEKVSHNNRLATKNKSLNRQNFHLTVDNQRLVADSTALAKGIAEVIVENTDLRAQVDALTTNISAYKLLTKEQQEELEKLKEALEACRQPERVRVEEIHRSGLPSFGQRTSFHPATLKSKLSSPDQESIAGDKPAAPGGNPSSQAEDWLTPFVGPPDAWPPGRILLCVLAALFCLFIGNMLYFRFGTSPIDRHYKRTYPKTSK